MNPTKCMRLLGLAESASVDEIKRAYRQLAQQLHPDKRGGDPDSRRRFAEISVAYRTLMTAARAAGRDRPVGTCFECGDLSELRIGPDGHARCPRCVLRPRGGRLLPLPIFVVVKCIATIVLLAAGAYLLLVAMAAESRGYAIAALIVSLAGLGTLAYTCLTVIYCLKPKEKRYQQEQVEARRQITRSPGRDL